MESVNLSYKIKLYPSANKADTLALLTALFARCHADSTNLLVAAEGRSLSAKGFGEFKGRAHRRAGIDFARGRKAWREVRHALTGQANLLDRKVKKLRKSAGRTDKQLVAAAKKYAPPRGIPIEQAQSIVNRQAELDGQKAERLTKRSSQLRQKSTRDYRPGTLKAELIDSAEIQGPRKAKSFDYWIMIRGTTFTRGKNGGFYVPANSHHGLNKTLALEGATLNEGAEVFRKNGKWYARVSVKVPVKQPAEPQGWIGCDVGVRCSVARSDGYRGPDLRPVLQRQKDRRAHHQRQGLDRSYEMSPQRQLLTVEARKVVSVALQTGQGVAVEDPARLIRWKQHASRFFASRVLLFCQLMGVAYCSIAPPYTSLTCSTCGSVESFRYKEMFRCHACGHTVNADQNAARNISQGAYDEYCHSRPALLRLVPRGGDATE